MVDFHSKNINSCLKELKTSEKGLSNKEASKRIEKCGFNELPKEQKMGKLSIFFSQFNNALVYILLLAGGLSIVFEAFVDAGVIFGAVIINVIIGFFQENKANDALSKLKSLVEHKAYVVREGQEIMIDSKLIVAGDVIVLKAGNRIPADARIIEANELQVNESSLTGESIPANKTTDEVPRGAALADRLNMVYASTVVVNGIGRAVITAIGRQTEIGKIAELVQEAEEEKTPLQKRLMNFSRMLGSMFAVICTLVVIIGLIQKRDLFEMIETGIAIGVASIPEGLTVAVTFILALGMQQILKEKALTRKLVAAETLGSITVICTDKTGTLTEGKMSVAHVIIGDQEYDLLEATGQLQEKDIIKVFSLALQTGMMCNDAIVENPNDELSSWKMIGTPTETALLSAAFQSGLRKEKLLKYEPQVDELPFDSARKYMISLHKKVETDNKKSSGEYVLYEKGAPEKLIDKSERFFASNKVKKITNIDKVNLIKTYERLTSKGLRVIGVVYKDIVSREPIEKGNIKWDEIDTNLTFIGFIAIKDPLRPEAKTTIETCKQAGIRPIIITGDHRLTAKAIAEEVGFKVGTENIVVGEELDNISDEELKKLIGKIDIYARVSPHHKLRIVKALQSKGEVVAMTGDGINDSPALKAADIGISLGTGTDIAKETSDIVLLDNNFKTIVSAIKQGRVIFLNIRKIITYLISDSFSEVILIVGSILFNAPLAILPVQILWINIVNDGAPDFSLAFEKDHGTVMKEKPIKKDVSILSSEMKYIIFVAGIIRDVVILLLFIVLWKFFYTEQHEISYLRTMFFAILGVKSLLSIFSIRSFHVPVWKTNPFSNIYLVFAVSFSFLMLLLGIYWGPLQSVLSTVSLGIGSWLIVMGCGLFSVILIELVKQKYIIKEK